MLLLDSFRNITNLPFISFRTCLKEHSIEFFKSIQLSGGGEDGDEGSVEAWDRGRGAKETGRESKGGGGANAVAGNFDRCP